MPEFDIVFEKLDELVRDAEHQSTEVTVVAITELDEIEELRRFSAETYEDSQPPSFTTT
jgi:hypothetical protein